MKLSYIWVFLFCFYYTFMDIFYSLFFYDGRRFISVIIQPFIFSTLLVAFFWCWRNAKTKNQ